jgi:selenocysteine lyase/cysteine desulfurase
MPGQSLGGWCQSVSHIQVNVVDLDVDFLAFSLIKCADTMGSGVLYGKTALLEKMPPFLGGGDMIRKVMLRSYAPNNTPINLRQVRPPWRKHWTECRSDYSSPSDGAIAAYEHEIVSYALDQLNKFRCAYFGPDADRKGGVVSFTWILPIRMTWHKSSIVMELRSAPASLCNAAARQVPNSCDDQGKLLYLQHQGRSGSPGSGTGTG